MIFLKNVFFHLNLVFFLQKTENFVKIFIFRKQRFQSYKKHLCKSWRAVDMQVVADCLVSLPVEFQRSDRSSADFFELNIKVKATVVHMAFLRCRPTPVGFLFLKKSSSNV